MQSIILLAVFLAAKLAGAVSINITSSADFQDTYLTPLEGHIGAAINLILVTANPDANWIFTPVAGTPDTGVFTYPLGFGIVPLGVDQFTKDKTNVWEMWTGVDSNNITIGAGGDLTLTGGAGYWVICDVVDDYYGPFTSLNYFNGTGTPDNASCEKVTLAVS